MKQQRFAVLARISCIFMVFFLIGSSLVHSASEVYPQKPITLVVPLAAGGYTDIHARLLAEAMEKELKQPVVVSNKPGGSMTIGGYTVASAKPDGYTIGLFPIGTALPEAFDYFYTAPYSSADLKPICRFATPVLAIMVRGDAPWNSLKEMIEYSRKNPRMKYAHTGKAGTGYMNMSTIARTEKLSLVDLPSEGDAATIPLILGGQIPIGIPAYPAVKSLVEAKKLKVLALCIDKRVSFAPGVPTVAELGYKQPYLPFLALYAPKKTPDEVVKRLEETIRKLVDNKEFQNKNKEIDAVLAYEDSASFEKALMQYKVNIKNFFIEEGLTK